MHNMYHSKVVTVILSILLSSAQSTNPSIYDQSVIQTVNSNNHTKLCGDWYAFNDEKCYTVFSRNRLKTFAEAIDACKQTATDASLVIIDSRVELRFLSDIIYTQQNIRQNVWIAGVSAMLESDIKNDDDMETNCVEIRRAQTNANAELHYAQCSAQNLVVCQRELNEMLSNLKTMVNKLNKDYMNVETRLRNAENEIQALKTKSSNPMTSVIPTGIVAYFASTSTPSGWLIANGSAVSRATYSNLFNTIGTVFGNGDGSRTFNLPDLRGEFIRGWSDGRNDVDKARVFGSFQYASNIPLSGYIDNNAYHALSSGFQDRWSFAGATFDNGFEANIKPGEVREGTRFPLNMSDSALVSYALTTGKFTHITSWNLLRGTRPRNVALLVCIKV